MENQSFWRERSVFVTGATGFLGGWLVKDLLDRGATVVALVRDGVSQSMLFRDGLIDRVIRVSGDLDDIGQLRRIMAEYSTDTVFHLAAQALVGVARVDPVGTLEANVRGTWNVLDAARQTRVRQIVVASSDKAYGPSEVLPYVETHPMQGVYPYDVSKSCADLICRMYAATYDLPVSIVRCANLFGGGDLNFSRTVPGAIAATLRGERFLIRSDGKFVRDFIYVRDASEAYLLLAEKLAGDAALRGEAFNFSIEVQLTVLELVHRILAMMNRQDLEPVVQNIVTAEIREQYAVSDKARRLLGWKPTYGLEAGLRASIDWYADFLAATQLQFASLTAGNA